MSAHIHTQRTFKCAPNEVVYKSIGELVTVYTGKVTPLGALANHSHADTHITSRQRSSRKTEPRTNHHRESPIE